MSVHLHCIVSNLKMISKMSKLPPWKNSADAHEIVHPATSWNDALVDSAVIVYLCNSYTMKGSGARAYRGQMAPRARNEFGAPMFESKVFQKQACCNEEIT